MRTSTSLLNSAVAVILPALLIKLCGYTNSEAIALYGVAMGMAVPMLFIPQHAYRLDCGCGCAGAFGKLLQKQDNSR